MRRSGVFGHFARAQALGAQHEHAARDGDDEDAQAQLAHVGACLAGGRRLCAVGGHAGAPTGISWPKSSVT